MSGCYKAFVDGPPVGWTPAVGESVLLMHNVPGWPVERVTIVEVCDVAHQSGQTIRTHRLSNGMYASKNSIRPLGGEKGAKA